LIDLLLARHHLSAPDGRPLHSYGATDAEFAALAAAIAPETGRLHTAPLFVLWAVEQIRRNYGSGSLTWDFLLCRMDLSGRRDLGIKWVADGLAFWKRPVRRRASDNTTLYLYSLLAEGGLPDAFLARGSGYASAVLGAIGDIEREALEPGDIGALDRIAAFRGTGLPAALQGKDSVDLLRDLAIAFVELRRELPDLLDIEAAQLWLDRNRQGWGDRLPLRLSQEARQAILLPALSRQIERPRGGVLAQRLLMPTAGGRAWAGVLRILRGGLLPFGLLPGADRTLVLRLVAADGSSFRASPDLGGWRVEAARDLLLALEPWVPAMLAAYADGVALGDAVIDPGLPEPGECPVLWRRERPGSDQALVPAVGGSSRGDRLWLLTAVRPVGDAGVTLHDPLPGPGGQVWPVSGTGKVGTLSIATGADEDAPEARLLILAETARAGRVDNGLPAYVGSPRILGARGDLPLRDVTAEVRVTSGRGLAVQRFDWVDAGEVIASTLAVFLPSDLSVALREDPAGLDVAVRGLPRDWRLAVHSGRGRYVLPLGHDRMPAGLAEADQGEITLEFFDAQGRSLRLIKPRPTLDPMLLDAAGQRVTASRQVSLRSLLGWRGVLPRKGVIELRMPKASHPVAFGEGGTLRLAAWRPLLAQVQALSGADGQVDLRLLTDRSSPQLKISRHDWQPTRQGNCFDLGPVPVDLHASTVRTPVTTRQTTASGMFDPSAWLADVADLWFVQGRSERGVMRPFPYGSGPVAPSTRDARIATYLAAMSRMMAEPRNPGWTDLVEVLAAARAGGDCGSLDQAQALGSAPEVAVALLFRAAPFDIAAALALETEVPIWWPAVPVTAWAKGMGAGLALVEGALVEAGLDPATVRPLAANHLARTAGTVQDLRPELSGHLGLGMRAIGLDPLALGSDGQARPLGAPRDPRRLADAARQLAARSPYVPQGATTLPLRHLARPLGFFEGLNPLLAAPLVVAEVALGLRPALTATEILDLLALRHADPQWFDTALPLGLSLA
jgi:hypothetical protein